MRLFYREIGMTERKPTRGHKNNEHPEFCVTRATHLSQNTYRASKMLDINPNDHKNLRLGQIQYKLEPYRRPSQ